MEVRRSSRLLHLKRNINNVMSNDTPNADCDAATQKRMVKVTKRSPATESPIAGEHRANPIASPMLKEAKYHQHHEAFNMMPSRKLAGPDVSCIDANIIGSETMVQRCLEEYCQLATSLFRRVYYDLSRGIAIPNDGVGYLFKYATNDISTSTYGMYGEIRPLDLQRICKVMEGFGLDEKSVVLDLGSGRGVPNIMFAHQKRVFASVGIEMCPVSYALSVNNLLHYLKMDLMRCILNSTVLGSAFKGPYGASRIHSRDGECGAVIESQDPATTTPKDTRLSKDALDNSGESVAKGDVLGSVETHINEGTLEVDEYATTPARETGDESDYYRALSRFGTVSSSLGLGFCNEDISAFDNYNGATHIYSFDIAMEKALVNNIVRQFTDTKTAWLFASFNSDLIERFGLRNCFLAAKVPCQMYKSGESRCCYVYVKNNWDEIKRDYDFVMGKLIAASTSESTIVLDSDYWNAQINAMPHLQRKGSNNIEEKSSMKCSNDVERQPVSPGGPSQAASVDSKGSPYDIRLTRFNEPMNLIELIKLSKLPMGAQIGWYLRKLNQSSPIITRSRGQNRISLLKARFCQYRSHIMECMATATNECDLQRCIEMLQEHIRNMYMGVQSLPNPPTWL